MRVGTFMVIVALFASIARAADPPSVATVKDNFEKQKYGPALEGIGKLLAARDGSVTPELRYELLTYKGESLLRLKQKSYAIDAFEDACRATTDPPKAAAARAMAVLVRASQRSLYVPASGGEGIDILEPEPRRKAMIALMKDQLAKLQPAIDSALAGASLTPMRALVMSISDAYVLELAATGKDTETRPPLEKLGQHARSLIEKELNRLHGELEDVNQSANEMVLLNGVWGSGDLVRKGLNTPQRQTLQTMTDYLKQIGHACQAGRRVAISFGVTGEKWDGVIADTDALSERAAEVLDRQY